MSTIRRIVATVISLACLTSVSPALDAQAAGPSGSRVRAAGPTTSGPWWKATRSAVRERAAARPVAKARPVFSLDGKYPAMPRNKQLVAPVPFKRLAFGKADYRKATPVVDFSEYSPAQVRMAYNFFTQKVPTNTCRLVDARITDPMKMQAEAQRYATCVWDSWRPLAKRIGAKPLPKIVIKNCWAKVNAKEPNCSTKESFAGMAEPLGVVLLGTGFEGGETNLRLSQIITHELAHQLQTEIVSGPGSQVLMAGVADYGPGSGMRPERRVELMAECLGWAMLPKSSYGSYQKIVDQGYLWGSDEGHWDEARRKWWVKQGVTRGTTAACYTTVADNSLLVHRP